MRKMLVDTNITLRYLVHEGTELNEKARELFAKADVGELTILIPEMVVAEVIWVLKSYYKQDQQLIATNLENFLRSDNLECSEAMIEAVRLYGIHKLDIVDLYLFTTSLAAKIPLITWDQKLKNMGCESYTPDELL